MVLEDSNFDTAFEIPVAYAIYPERSFPSPAATGGQTCIGIRGEQACGIWVDERQGKVLGEVRDRWLAREMMLAYFADKEVISPAVSHILVTSLTFAAQGRCRQRAGGSNQAVILCTTYHL
jgi:hypothetical protein